MNKVKPVAWTNKDITYVELSTPSTVYGSHTIPLYTVDAVDTMLQELEQQLDVAAEFCRQYQIESKVLSVENKQLKEKLQIRDNQVASKKAVIEEFEIQNKQLKAQSDVDNEINLQLNLKIMELEAENKQLGDYYMKINSMYWNDEIFEVNHGEGFYTDKFVEVVADL